MSDNKLRCVLVYRLQRTKTTSADSSSSGGGGVDGIALTNLSPGPVTLLAKYDHASEYESHEGSAAGGLYGDREKNYADAVAMVISGDPPRGITEENTIGGFKIVQSDMHQVIYGADSRGLCLAVVTGLKYPSRTAIQMLSQLYPPYMEQFSLQYKAATTNALSKKSKPLLSEYCNKYDDATKVDKASMLHSKVEEVKVTMQDNIAAMLRNTEQAESLAERSNQLNEQATVFQKKSKDLRKQMRCKNIKTTVILVSIVVGILIIVLVPLIVRARNAVKGNRMLRGGGEIDGEWDADEALFLEEGP